jgi:hypothetical protein
MRIVLIILLLSCFTQDVSATAQISDRLIYEGKSYHLHNNPLEAYFKKYPKKRPEGDLTNPALWRGYIATFEIKNQALILTDLKIQVYEHEEGKEEWAPGIVLKSVLKEVFPEEEALKIDWCTEVLILPFGKLIHYVDNAYASTFEQYVLLEMKAGILTQSKTFDLADYLAFKKQQLERFKATTDYQTYLTKWKEKYDYSEEEVDRVLETSIFKYLDGFLE